MNSRKNHEYPPEWADRFLAWFCDPELLPEIQGDLHESFQYWVQVHGVSKARWLYLLNVITFFRPYFIARIKFSYLTSQSAMIKNYYLIAIRSLVKQKLYAFINIGGLAVGLACFILILLFVQHELSYDRFHEKADQIYRVVQRRPGQSFLGLDYWVTTSPAMASTLVSEFPEVTTATTVGKTFNSLLSLGDHQFQEEGLWADTRFFDIFTFPLVQGNPETALTEPRSIILTESFAQKIFGTEDPMGQTLLYQNRDAYKVTGIMADVPETSHLTFDFILPIQSNHSYNNGLKETIWFNNEWYTYFALAEGTDVRQLEEKIRSYEDLLLTEWKPEDRIRYFFQPLTAIHLHSQQMPEASGDIKYVYLFSAIAFLILLLACVNYTNLAIARSIKRAREVGLRKVIGANRSQLITQFMGESVLLTFLALVLALGLVQLFLPFFSQLVERPIRINYLENEMLLPGLVVLLVLVALFSGSYPAFFMSAVRPIQVLKGKINVGTGKFKLQRLLIVGQYTVSITLVAVSFVIYQQLQYIQHKDLGFDREHVVTIRVNDETLAPNFSAIRDEWLQDSHITSVTSSIQLPTNIQNFQVISSWDGNSGDGQMTLYWTGTGYDFLDVFGIGLVAGRTFSPAYATDISSATLINETAAHAFGWSPEEAVGKQFNFGDGNGDRTIIGVVKDFHMHSMHLPIEPLMIRLDTDRMQYISAKVRPENLTGTIAMLEKTVKQFSSYPFEYQFLDEQFNQLYKQEIRLGEIFGFFTILTLLIASLGLFGLAAFTAEQRTKEIGIRKVLGASVQGIVSLLAKNFLSTVVFSCFLAVPIAWYIAHRWLQDFAYRINMEWWIFALASGLAIVIAWGTISYQSIRAARANPVDSLKNE